MTDTRRGFFARLLGFAAAPFAAKMAAAVPATPKTLADIEPLRFKVSGREQWMNQWGPLVDHLKINEAELARRYADLACNPPVAERPDGGYDMIDVTRDPWGYISVKPAPRQPTFAELCRRGVL